MSTNNSFVFISYGTHRFKQLRIFQTWWLFRWNSLILFLLLIHPQSSKMLCFGLLLKLFMLLRWSYCQFYIQSSDSKSNSNDACEIGISLFYFTLFGINNNKQKAKMIFHQLKRHLFDELCFIDVLLNNELKYNDFLHLILMLGDNLNKPQQNFTLDLFSDWLNPSTGRRSRSQSKAFLEQYQDGTNGNKSIGGGLIDKLINITDVQVEQNFSKEFTHGRTMEIWRKGRVKVVEMFLDPALPNLLWVSSKTKAFLFDLTYTTVNRFDLQLQKSSKIKDYIVLHYFQESLPIVFRGESVKQANKYFKLFNDYIIYNNLMNVYPPYFSRIMKLYTMEANKDSVSRKKKTSDVLKVSQLIGLTQKARNWKILQAVTSRITNQSLTDHTEITHDKIGDYFKIVHCCEQMKPIFQKYASFKLDNYYHYLSPILPKSTFQQFLIYDQKQDEAIIKEILDETKDKISFYDFCCYLMSEKTNYVAFAEQTNQSYPLTDYFCYSSHNTYLSGNQLTSDSKIERYIQDLQGGLKCVEIDVHNDDHRPIITHALNDKSFCKPIDFQETIEAINKFCNHHPHHYPIVISVENHASDANRYKMLNILFNAFDKKLLIVNNEDPHESLQKCKKLVDLKGKIIIKTDSNINEILAFRKQGKQKIVKCETSSFMLPIFDPAPVFRNRNFQDQYDQYNRHIRQFQVRKNYFMINNPKQLYIPLAEMTKITGMFKSPTGINNEQSTGYECTSLTNQKAGKTEYNKLVKYTNRSWLRIYPLGTEIASSNYNPIPPLKVGAQIIALNTQTKDDYAWLMMSYFTAGRPLIPSKIGYILKPPHLRGESYQSVSKLINIKIVSSIHKVTIKFFGTEDDTKINSNSAFDFNVKDFNEGFLMFTINNKFKQCIPLRFIRKGYRVLIAKNEMFRDSGIRVLILVNIKQLTYQ